MVLSENKFMIYGALAAAVALYIIVKKKGGLVNVAADAGTTAGEAAVAAAGGFVAGASESIGDGLGVPRTNLTACEQAKAEGRTLDASFACPAGDFLSYLNPFK